MRTLGTEFYSLWKDDICHQYEYSTPIGGRLPGSASASKPNRKESPAGRQKGKPEPKPPRRRDSSRLRRANRAGRRIHLYQHSRNVAFMPQESNGESLDSSSDRRRSCGPYAPMDERSAAARASVQRSTSPSCSASTITRATGSVPE